MDSKDLLKGTCFCGQVQYQITLPLKFIVHDHCSICRRISGAPYVTWCGVKEEQMNLLKGAEYLSHFRSSPEAIRSFCKECGSHLFFRSQRWPGEVHFTRASITHGVLPSPGAHVFYSDRVSWGEFAKELPCYGGNDGLTPLTDPEKLIP